MSVTLDEGFAHPIPALPLRADGVVGHALREPDLLPVPPVTVGVIEAIATGAPAQIFDQAGVVDHVASLFDDPAQRARIPRIYQKTRIATRHLAIDPLDPEFLEFSSRPGTIRDRMNLFYEHAVPLAVDVARRAIAGLQDPEQDLGLLVFVTSTGFIAPGVDAAVINQLGLSKSMSRLTVNFMGCAAAMNGIRTATDFVRANPDRKALVICIEVSSVNAVFADDINDIITHSLFGDGCGAVVIGARQAGKELAPGSVVIRDSFTRLLDGAADGIVLGVNHDGITCELAEDLPQYIIGGVDAPVTEVLDRNNLTKDDIDLWAIHPGGPKIIESSAASLGIDADTASVSWGVLAEYGNMLSVSLLFVLERMITAGGEGEPRTTGIAFSFGPGVTLEGIVFDIIRHES